MGIGPNGTNFAKIGGVSTPMVVSQSLKATTPVKKTVAPPKPKERTTGTNAQTEAYGKAMNSAFKNTKTYGVPGAK